MYFDRVIEQQDSGKFYIYAIDDKKNIAYPINIDAVIETSKCGLNGLSLKITARPDTYTYRGKFHSEKEMNDFSKQIGKLLEIADSKNNSVFFSIQPNNLKG